MVILLVLFIIGVALPNALGNHRFKVVPEPTKMLDTYKFFLSKLKLFSALAIAESKSFSTGRAARLVKNFNCNFAGLTSIPLIKFATKRTFRGDILKLFNFANTSTFTCVQSKKENVKTCF
jgi:hypothetical protein